MRRDCSRVLALSVALLASGCLGNPSVRPDDEPAGTGDFMVPAPAVYQYACGGAGSTAPCYRTFADLRNAYTEPYVAADPSRLGVFAVGVIVWPFAGDLAVDSVDGSSDDPKNDLLLTQDAGATWRLVTTPRPAPPSSDGTTASFDPSDVFDSKGVLHHTGIVRWQANANRIYYTRSADLGATWSDPVILDDHNPDRNWIVVDAQDRLYMTWHARTGAAGSVLATSTDGGMTWEKPSSELLLGCFTTSRPTFADGNALFACSVGTDPNETKGIRVLAFDATDQRVSLMAEIPVTGDFPGWPQLVRAGSDFLLFIDVFDLGGRGPLMAASADGGATWSAFSETTALTPPGLPRDRVLLRWVETDPWGRAHVIWKGINGPIVDADNLRRGTTTQLGHSILGSSSDVLQSALIGDVETSAHTDGRTLAYPYNWADDFAGISFGPDQRGLIAWSENMGLVHAFVVPAP